MVALVVARIVGQTRAVLANMPVGEVGEHERTTWGLAGRYQVLRVPATATMYTLL
ncbi:MAG: hypothetical protein ACYC5O_03810 [Anaerolineae bacterium]